MTSICQKKFLAEVQLIHAEQIFVIEFHHLTKIDTAEDQSRTLTVQKNFFLFPSVKAL